jgi:hypothetical protein
LGFTLIASAGRALHAMVVRDGIDPQVVHTAFLEIDEYRAIVDGIGGAESYEDI